MAQKVQVQQVCTEISKFALKWEQKHVKPYIIIECVLGRKKLKSDRLNYLYLVKWSGQKQDTWETKTLIQQNNQTAFKQFNNWLMEDDCDCKKELFDGKIWRPEADSSPALHENNLPFKLKAVGNQTVMHNVIVNQKCEEEEMKPTSSRINSKIQQLLARKVLKKNKSSETQYLVRWSGRKQDTWESFAFIQQSNIKALLEFYDWVKQQGAMGKRSNIARPEAQTSSTFSHSQGPVKVIGSKIVLNDNNYDKDTVIQKKKKQLNKAKSDKLKSKGSVAKAKNVKTVDTEKTKKACSKALIVLSKHLAGAKAIKCDQSYTKLSDTKQKSVKQENVNKITNKTANTNQSKLKTKQADKQLETKSASHVGKTGKQTGVVASKQTHSGNNNKGRIANKRIQNIQDSDDMSQSSGSESDTLYSLNDTHLSSKRLKLELIDVKETPVSSRASTPELDPEITFKLSSPAKRMLLKDSVKKKQVPKSKEGSRLSSDATCTMALPSTPTSLLSTPYKQDKTPPGTPSRSPSETTPTKADMMEDFLPNIPVMPLLHNSPASCYKNLMKNLQNLQADRGVKRKQGGSSEPVERRTSVRQSESVYKYKEIVVKKCSSYTQIWLSTQTKMKNSFNPQVFSELIQALHNAKFDDSRLVMLSGSGNVFCSGIDLDYIAGDHKKNAKKMADALKEFVSVLISFPKPLVAAVNGSAVGLGTAILPLCDIVYASDKASFHCPYTRLSQTPEGCSSYTFPQVMGVAMANEMLLGGRKITATEAYHVGLVSQVFWPDGMMQLVIPRIQQMAQYSAKALEASKLLIRSHQKAKLEFTCDSECQILADRWSSSECLGSIISYLDKEQDIFL